jgi:hypothetical protein
MENLEHILQELSQEQMLVRPTDVVLVPLPYRRSAQSEVVLKQ